jgi:hypothetical protein
MILLHGPFPSFIPAIARRTLPSLLTPLARAHARTHNQLIGLVFIFIYALFGLQFFAARSEVPFLPLPLSLPLAQSPSFSLSPSLAIVVLTLVQDRRLAYANIAVTGALYSLSTYEHSNLYTLIFQDVSCAHVICIIRRITLHMYQSRSLLQDGYWGPSSGIRIRKDGCHNFSTAIVPYV